MGSEMCIRDRDELITDRYPLERINEAVEAVRKGNVMRNVIVFD